MSNSERILSNNQKITDNNTDLETIITRIKQIPAPLDTSDATATADDILKDKTAYVDGKKLTGTLEVNLQDKEVEITENGETEITADEGYDGLGTVNITTNVASSGGFTGHYDKEGLMNKLGWTEEDVDFYQQNGVFWNDDIDETFKVTDDDVTYSTGTSTRTRFVKANTNMTSCESKKSLIAIPKNTFSSKITSFGSVFYNCASLKAVPILNTSKITIMESTFSGCHSLKTISQLDTSNVTNMYGMFRNCYSLVTIPQLNTTKNTTFKFMFAGCYALSMLPKLNAQLINGISGFLNDCASLVILGGFENLGQNYSTSASSGNSDYTLTLSVSPLLTHDSLMNVINNLYDIATKGCQPQKLVLGTINLAKLTEEEKALATVKRLDFKLKNKRRKLK